MESTEAIQHVLHPLKDNYFIDEVELSHTFGKDYWLGKAGTDLRVWLSNKYDDAQRLAEEKIG